MSLDLVFSFAPQQVGRMERLAIESFVAAGYTYVFYSYFPERERNIIPVPACYADAATILPRSECVPDPDGSYKTFMARFKFAALLKHGGLWADPDYVLLRRLPDLPYLAVTCRTEADEFLLCTELIRLPQGCFLAYQAGELIAEVCGSENFREALGIALGDYWPRDLRTTTLSCKDALPIPINEAADMVLDPAYCPDVSKAYGMSMRRDVWAATDRASESRFSPDSLYELTWARYYGARTHGVARSQQRSLQTAS